VNHDTREIVVGEPGRASPLWPAWVAALLLAGAAVLPWLRLPLEGPLHGLRLGLQGPWFESGPPPLTLFSYGGLSLLLAALALLALLLPGRRRAAPWVGLGIAAWGLALLFLVRLAARLDDWTALEDQLQQLTEAVGFARRFCEAHFSGAGLPPYAPLRLQLQPFLERAAGSFMFLSWGAIPVALAGGFSLFLGFSLTPLASRWRWWVVVLLSLTIMAGAAGLGAVLGDRQLASAAAHLSRGQAEAARRLLEETGRDRPQLFAYAPFVYLLGEAHHRLNLESPARRFYLGARLYPERGGASPPLDLNRLRDEWTRAALGADPRQAGMVRRLLAWAHIQEGFRGLKHSPAAALPYLEQALSLSPQQQQVRLYLAKARLDLREPTRALADLEEFGKNCRFRFLNGLALALRGDAHFQMGRVPEARDSYELSLRTYHHANYRALKGLVGH